jgi:hypothetical protein
LTNNPARFDFQNGQVVRRDFIVRVIGKYFCDWAFYLSNPPIRQLWPEADTSDFPANGGSIRSGKLGHLGKPARGRQVEPSGLRHKIQVRSKGFFG